MRDVTCTRSATAMLHYSKAFGIDTDPDQGSSTTRAQVTWLTSVLSASSSWRHTLQVQRI
jgi:hypothetical protein